MSRITLFRTLRKFKYFTIVRVHSYRAEAINIKEKMTNINEKFRFPQCEQILREKSNITINTLIQWRIQDFPEGAPTPKMRLFCKLFSENCTKMKGFGSRGRPWHPPLGSANVISYFTFETDHPSSADTNIRISLHCKLVVIHQTNHLPR